MKHRSLGSKIMLAGWLGTATGVLLWVGGIVWTKMGFSVSDTFALMGGLLVAASVMVALVGVTMWFGEPGYRSALYIRRDVPESVAGQRTGAEVAMGLGVKLVVASAAAILLSFGLCGVGAMLSHGGKDNVLARLGIALFLIACACLALAFTGAIMGTIAKAVFYAARNIWARYRKDEAP